MQRRPSLVVNAEGVGSQAQKPLAIVVVGDDAGPIRTALDEAGYKDAQIVGSSGFDPQKCQVMGAANAPLDIVGTGSFHLKTALLRERIGDEH